MVLLGCVVCTKKGMVRSKWICDVVDAGNTNRMPDTSPGVKVAPNNKCRAAVLSAVTPLSFRFVGLVGRGLLVVVRQRHRLRRQHQRQHQHQHQHQRQHRPHCRPWRCMRQLQTWRGDRSPISTSTPGPPAWRQTTAQALEAAKCEVKDCAYDNYPTTVTNQSMTTNSKPAQPAGTRQTHSKANAEVAATRQGAGSRTKKHTDRYRNAQRQVQKHRDRCRYTDKDGDRGADRQEQVMPRDSQNTWWFSQHGWSESPPVTTAGPNERAGLMPVEDAV